MFLKIYLSYFKNKEFTLFFVSFILLIKYIKKKIAKISTIFFFYLLKWQQVPMLVFPFPPRFLCRDFPFEFQNFSQHFRLLPLPLWLQNANNNTTIYNNPKGKSFA